MIIHKEGLEFHLAFVTSITERLNRTINATRDVDRGFSSLGHDGVLTLTEQDQLQKLQTHFTDAFNHLMGEENILRAIVKAAPGKQGNFNTLYDIVEKFARLAHEGEMEIMKLRRTNSDPATIRTMILNVQNVLREIESISILCAEEINANREALERDIEFLKQRANNLTAFQSNILSWVNAKN